MASHGAELIAKERERQIQEEGWTEQHDDSHTPGDLATAGACYALGAAAFSARNSGIRQRLTEAAQELWPWGGRWWKPVPNPIRELTKAGALIAAEIDRLEREQDSAKR